MTDRPLPHDYSRWRQVRELFDAAITLTPDAREDYLRGNVGDSNVLDAVRQLLRVHDEMTGTGSGRDGTPAAPALAPMLARLDLERDTVIGGFRIERTLGEGGMGRVYLASREVDGAIQRVALKIVPVIVQGKRAVDQLRRERAILAGLDHPNVARLIEAGELPDNRPYFAMEYVDGLPITRHCDEAALSLHARIQLFLDVCEAVAYAHRRLVLHRDLKPGNILVDVEGRVRLLDFGIAKSIEGAAAQARETTASSSYFSLRCAAPEQVMGRATSVATDIYGLGCLLHELLTGNLPFQFAERGHEDIIRRIVHEPPALASESVRQSADRGAAAAASRQLAGAAALHAALRGDLDIIVARCLRKAADDRYRSVDDFGADLRNVLEHRPIAARSSERWYRLHMLLRRHRLTAVVTVTLGLAVLATTALSLVQSQRAEAERDRAVAALASAQLQRDHARRVVDFLVNAFRAADPANRRGAELRASELLDSAVKTLQDDRGELDLELHATIAQTLAHLFYTLERTPDALRQAEMARADMARIRAPSEELRVRQSLVDAEIHYLQNRYADASAVSTSALQRLEQAGLLGDGDLLYQLWSVRARAILASGDNKATQRTVEQAIAAITAQPGYRPRTIDWLKHRRISAVSASGDFSGAMKLLQELQAELDARGNVDESTAIETQRLIGQTHLRLGQHAQSVIHLEQALARHVSAYGEDDARVAHLISGVAGAYSNVKRNAESMLLYRRAVELGKKYFGEASPFVANQYFNMGRNYLYDLGDLKLSEYYLRRAVQVCPPEARGSMAIMQRKLGEFLLSRGKLFEAEPYVANAHRELVAIYGDGREVTDAHINLAYLHFRHYDFDAARALLTPGVVADVRAYIAAWPINSADIRAQLDEMSTFYRL